MCVIIIIWTGDGFATKLIVDEEGKIRNEYVEDDGSISVGDYDMVPLIDRFCRGTS